MLECECVNGERADRMKLKEINRTAIQAWSPAQQHPVYLATGTSAQQLDASFSTSASLEIFQLDLTDPTLDMKTSGTFSSPHRYHQLAWGPHGIGSDGHPSGVLIAGGENGNIILYDPAKILDGSSDVVIDQSTKHTGPVRALDVNPFQTNLFASGGNESEIYIWDLNSFSSPMTPGPKSQPLEDVSCVAWNGQVQHILASASPSGRASIWDLRKNDLIIKVSDHSNRMHCSGLAWHPEVATQLALASEDDRMPVIQMWDLRFATSPLKVLENHTRGVLAIAWSLADPELLLSCGKDNRILCWDPNTAEVLYELPTSSQWCFDIQWCPRNPALLSAAAFDGHISVYSIMGGKNDAVSLKQADQISTSFGNLDPFGTGQTLPPLQLPQAPTAPSTVTPLKKPPKWIRRPVGASFAFGGKLVSLENGNPLPQPTQQPLPRVVHVSQVVTETAFLERSSQLQATLSAGSFAEFCQTKIEAAPSEFEKAVWSFLKVNFEDDSRGKYLELLGYKKEELALKIAEALEKKDSQPAEAVSEPLAVPESQPEPEPEPEPQTQEPEAEPAPPEPTPDFPADSFSVFPADSFSVSQPVILHQLHQPEAVPEPQTEPAVELVPPPQVEPAIPPELAAEHVPKSEVELAPEPETQVEPISEVEFVPEAEVMFAPGPQAEVQPELQAASPAASLHLTPEAMALVDLQDFSVPTLAPPLNLQQQPVSLFAPPCEVQQALPVFAPPSDIQQSLPLFAPSPAQLLLAPADQLPPGNTGFTSPPYPSDASAVPLAAPGFGLAPMEVPAPQIDLASSVDLSFPPVAQLPWEPEEEVELQLEEDMLPEPEPVAVVEPEKEEEKEEEEEEEEAADDLIEEPLEDPTEDISTGPAEPAREPEVAVEPPAPAPSVSEPVKLKVSKEVDGLITQALLTGDFESAVDLCLHDNRMADSIILAIAGGPELLERTQKKYFLKTQTKITKLISAVVMRDWLDILQTCELHSWREALAAVMTYAKPEDFSNLCGLLGSRLEQAEDLSLQAQACLCYICAGSVEKLVTCWTKAQESQCPLSLQDLVEKVVILRQAVERTHGAQASTMGAMLAQKMGQYASLLASQGSLDTALAYLPENSNQEVVERLRDRLSRALGHQAAPVTATPQAPSAHPAPTNMPTARPAAAPAYAYNQQHSAQPVPAPAPAHTAPQYYQQFRSASTVTSWSNQTPTVLPSAPRPLGPAPEPQVDPSVPPFGLQAPVSAAPPASSAPGYMHSQQYPQIFPHYNAGAAAPPALYNPLQYSSSPPSGGAAYPPSSSAPYPHHYMPSAAPYPPSPATAYPSHPHHHHPPPLPHSLPSPPAASVAPSFPSPPPVASSSFAPSSPPPLMGGSTFQQGGLGSPVSNVPPALLPPGASGSMSQDENDLAEGPQNGWNDPPNLTRGPKKKKVLDNYAPPAPITAPIMSPLGEPQSQAPAGPPQPYPQPGLQAPYAPMQHHPPQGVAPAPGPPSVPLMNLQGAPGAPTGDRIQPMQKLPAEKVSKKPIPQEHMMLKTTFEGLVQKCLAAASDPQTKRKLDVANKRLEMLYDKLREQSLSPAIVGGLHNMARSIESRAYTDGLNIHTHIVSSSNFSEISAFMPVLKVLLTEAIKLGV
ncbi:hypothetical protein AALO_G00163560 [Alosa alosa]|uniref:Protein transport protein Sec31A n=1 Tax=Alosa alosa TaxID=278164 RepID=A0AAV6GF78_9TELE|nr:hypothetical protein AALO_G00163560 [Alosa alosa]